MPTTPGSGPPWPGSTNTVLAEAPLFDGKLMHAPGCEPLSATCPATMPGVVPDGPPPSPPTERTAANTRGKARTQVIASATMSAGRSSDIDLCRRRVRAGTLAAFAIGRVILVAGTAPHVREPP